MDESQVLRNLVQKLFQATEWGLERFWDEVLAPQAKSPLAGSLSAEEFRQLIKPVAEVRCHGMITTHKSAEQVYREFFAPDANSEWAGTLTLEEVKKVFEWTHPH